MTDPVPQAKNSNGHPVAPAGAEWIVEHAERGPLGNFAVGLAHETPNLFKGFKVSPDSIAKKPLRTRVARLLSHRPDLLSVLLEQCPGPWTEAARALAEWTPEQVRKRWRALTRAHGTPLIPLAMILSNEKPVAARGRRTLARANLWQPTVKLTPKTEDSKHLAPLRILLPPAQPRNQSQAVPSAPKSAASKQDAKLRQALEKAKTQLSDVRNQAAQKQQAFENELRSAQKQLHECRQRLHGLQTDREKEVLRRIQLYRRNVLGIHENPARATPNNSLPHDTLVNQADQLLEEQASLDEKYGTRARLRQQLDQTRTRLERLEEAAANSLAPHPELARTRKLLTNHLSDIEETLGTDWDEAPEPARSFLRQIQTIPADEHADKMLDAILDTLERPTIRAMLRPAWMRELRIAAEKKRETCKTIHNERIAALTEANDPEQTAAPQPPKEIFNIARELHQTNPAKLQIFVDAYNVLLDEDGNERIHLPAARRSLEQKCRRLLPNLQRIELVYDGVDAVETRELDGNIVKSFAPKRSEDQNADNQLIAKLQQPPPDKQTRRWMVTSDYGLRARAQNLCDAFVESQTFQQFLNNQ
ncbi:MAG: hypothetical protein ACOCWJ_01940 [Verrucomicrobiota bacterium]